MGAVVVGSVTSSGAVVRWWRLPSALTESLSVCFWKRVFCLLAFEDDLQADSQQES